MRLEQRYEGVLGYFSRNVPVAESELEYGNAFQLLVAVMLSAQCTDKRVNMVTPALFARYPDPESMAAADRDELLSYVKSVSYPASKTDHLIAASRILVERFGSRVPSERDELMSLPGVGRKTASVVASIVYGKPVVAVDTHIFRVARRIGLSEGRTPEAVSTDLERHVPGELRPICHHWLLLHGRYVCTARKPACGQCALREWCKYFKSQDR